MKSVREKLRRQTSWRREIEARGLYKVYHV